MSQRNKNNSIIFLTTLSVYLGLVLVGGALSPVLAQAATTRNFNVQDEIEVKDDLDNKPDDELDNLTDLTGNYFDNLKDFVANIQKLHQIEKFDLDFDSFYLEESNSSQCNLETTRKIVSVSNVDRLNNRWLSPAIVDATRSFEDYSFIGDCLINTDFDNHKAVSYGIKISYDKSSLKFEVSLTKDSPKKAEKLLERFNQSYKLYEVDKDEVIIKQIYEHTSFKSENNQVFIITRLPRGSLDELFKQSAKADNQ